MKPMRCGNCGGEDHKIFKQDEDRLLVKCIKCNNQSYVVASKPTLKVEWVACNDGILAEF